MDFLNRLYESNYFGIGLFAVISFLVLTFLIVLFFGKRDEKKRKLEETNKLTINNEDAFKETTVPTNVEIAPVDLAPVAPIPQNQEEPIIAPIETPAAPVEPVKEIMPVNPEPLINTPEVPIINEAPVTPIVDNLKIEPIINEPSEVKYDVPVTPIENIEPLPIEPIIPNTPISMEPTKITIPASSYSEQTLEPTKIDLNEPVISEKEEEIPPIIEEPVIPNTYYQPVEKPAKTEVKVPNIDFDAIAKSISAELDELEKNKQVPVTPINNITHPEPNLNFSSVYVDTPKRPTPKNEPIDLPKKIDLPKRIDK